MEYEIELEQEEDGRWIAEIASIPGAISYGSSCEEASLRVLQIADEISKNTFATRHRAVITGLMAGAIGVVVAALTYYPWFHLWMAVQPDCSPGQHDGQCGLTTFINAIFAIPCAGVTGILAAIWIYKLVMRGTWKKKYNR